MVDHFVLEVGDNWMKVDKMVTSRFQREFDEVMFMAKMLSFDVDIYCDFSNDREVYVDFKYENNLCYQLHFKLDLNYYLGELYFTSYYKGRHKIVKDRCDGKLAMLSLVMLLKSLLVNQDIEKAV